MNAGVFDTVQSDQQAAEILDTHPKVKASVKNDRLGFVVPYRKDGTPKRCFPDFLVVLEDGETLVSR